MFPSPSLCRTRLTLKSLEGAWELCSADGPGGASLMELSEKRQTRGGGWHCLRLKTHLSLIASSLIDHPSPLAPFPVWSPPVVCNPLTERTDRPARCFLTWLAVLINAWLRVRRYDMKARKQSNRITWTSKRSCSRKHTHPQTHTHAPLMTLADSYTHNPGPAGMFRRRLDPRLTLPDIKLLQHTLTASHTLPLPVRSPRSVPQGN